jgi:hypothetical protein
MVNRYQCVHYGDSCSWHNHCGFQYAELLTPISHTLTKKFTPGKRIQKGALPFLLLADPQVQQA